MLISKMVKKATVLKEQNVFYLFMYIIWLNHGSTNFWTIVFMSMWKLYI